MKALVSINFALEIDDEDELTELAGNIDGSMREAVTRAAAANEDDLNDFIRISEIAGKIDWYGASITLRKPVLDAARGGDD
jgi:cytidylate kinase